MNSKTNRNQIKSACDGLTKDMLLVCVGEGLSERQIATRFNVPASSLHVKLQRFGLKTSPSPRRATKEHRAAMSAAQRIVHQNPEYKAHHLAAMQSSETKSKLSVTMKERWQDPEYKIAHIDSLHSSENRIKSATIMGTVEFSKKMSDIIKAKWQDPEYKNMVIGATTTEEFRTRMSRISSEVQGDLKYKTLKSGIAKAKWQDPEYRDNVITALSVVRNTTEYRENLLAAINSPENRKICSENSAMFWGEPGRKEAQSALLSALWQDPSWKEKMAIARATNPKTLTKPHRVVCEVLDSLGIKFQNEYTVSFWNFDIFVPDFNLLIEVQGDYWHTLPGAIGNDKRKARYITEHRKDLRLKFVWEHEVKDINKITEKIKYWCGLTQLELVDYEIKDVMVQRMSNAHLGSMFLDGWHYQNAGRVGTDYGAYLSGELIAICRYASIGRQGSAAHVGYTTNQVWELTRLCVHPRYQKKNLLTWFLARIEKDIKKNRPDIKCLISFTDTSQGHTGAIYKAANWEFHSVSAPSYHYTDVNNDMISKKTLWNNAKKAGAKEAEYAEQHGFRKVQTLEKFKFVRHLYPGRPVVPEVL